MLANKLFWVGLVLTACGGPGAAEQAGLNTGAPEVPQAPGHTVPVTATVPQDIQFMTPATAAADRDLQFTPQLQLSGGAALPDDVIWLRATGLYRGKKVVMAQGSTVASEHRFCGPATADAYGWASAPCHVDPNASGDLTATLYEDTLQGRVLATMHAPLAMPSDAVWVTAQRDILDLRVLARGRGEPLRETNVSLADPYGQMIAAQIVPTDASGTWRHEFLLPGTFVRPGRYTVEARQTAAGAQAWTRFDVTPVAFGHVDETTLGVIGFGFGADGRVSVEFFDPSGALAILADGTTHDGFTLITADTPRCAPPGQWIARVHYRDTVLESQWVDVPVTANHGFCVE